MFEFIKRSKTKLTETNLVGVVWLENGGRSHCIVPANTVDPRGGVTGVTMSVALAPTHKNYTHFLSALRINIAYHKPYLRVIAIRLHSSDTCPASVGFLQS